MYKMVQMPKSMCENNVFLYKPKVLLNKDYFKPKTNPKFL